MVLYEKFNMILGEICACEWKLLTLLVWADRLPPYRLYFKQLFTNQQLTCQPFTHILYTYIIVALTAEKPWAEDHDGLCYPPKMLSNFYTARKQVCVFEFKLMKHKVMAH